MPPTDFAIFASGQIGSIEVLSNIMKRLIAQALGREVAGGAALR
jgi:hypothetical protein